MKNINAKIEVLQLWVKNGIAHILAKINNKKVYLYEKKLTDENDKTLIYMCAFRYALGRRSYIVRTVVEFILEHLKAFNRQEKQLMIREIDEANDLGDQVDIEDWMFLKKRLEYDTRS